MSYIDAHTFLKNLGYIIPRFTKPSPIADPFKECLIDSKKAAKFCIIDVMKNCRASFRRVLV